MKQQLTMENDELKTKRPNVVRYNSLAFAIAVAEPCKELQVKKEFILSNQLMRSGTAIGELVREAEQVESSKDHKLSIALKEANETDFLAGNSHENGLNQLKSI